MPDAMLSSMISVRAPILLLRVFTSFLLKRYSYDRPFCYLMHPSNWDFSFYLYRYLSISRKSIVISFNDPFYQLKPAYITATEVVKEQNVQYFSLIANNYGEVYNSDPYGAGESCYNVDGVRSVPSYHKFTKADGT